MNARFTPPSVRRADDASLPLERRGIRHGSVTPQPLSDVSDAEQRWDRGAPIPWPALLTGLGTAPHASSLAKSSALFDRLRDGSRWLDECERMITPGAPFIYTSSTVDAEEPREIERLFVNALDIDGDVLAEDITARLSWIATDEEDLSLRIRFSFGHESLREWLNPDDARALLADDFASHVFDECDWIDTDSNRAALADLRGGSPTRLSERIVYSNAPGGGAVFHHDADPNQRGVLFTQLVGQTAWLALPRIELEAALVEFAPEQYASGKDLLAESIDEAMWTILNATPGFTALLAAKGALFTLAPGDALILPSPTPERTAWHSVFALGEEPSLAHSYGIFDAFGS